MLLLFLLMIFVFLFVMFQYTFQNLPFHLYSSLQPHFLIIIFSFNFYTLFNILMCAIHIIIILVSCILVSEHILSTVNLTVDTFNITEGVYLSTPFRHAFNDCIYTLIRFSFTQSSLFYFQPIYTSIITKLNISTILKSNYLELSISFHNSSFRNHAIVLHFIPFTNAC